jgi:hypothetical protein
MSHYQQTMQKGFFSVNPASRSDHKIALEVTVPRIVLPSLTPDKLIDDTEIEPAEDAEQLSLLTTPPQQGDHMPRLTRVTDITPEVTTHATITGAIFHLFHLKITVTAGRLYLIRIRHRQKPQKTGPQKDIPQQHSPFIDDLACSITFTASTDDSREQPARRLLTPGHHEVVIQLDEEGIPTSYRIDGAEG